MDAKNSIQNVTIKKASLIREVLSRVYSVLVLTDLIPHNKPLECHGRGTKGH